jgi:hypothetical protein
MPVDDYNARTNLAAEASVVLVKPQLPPSSVPKAVNGTAARDVHAQIVTVCMHAQIVTVCVCVHKLLRFVCMHKLLRFVCAGRRGRLQRVQAAGADASHVCRL